MGAPGTIFTIGHSTRSLAEFVGLLRESGAALLADVRSFPRSRANPQFNAETLAPALAAEGIGYRHLPALGGRRGRRRDAPPSPNVLWQTAAFRNYADYAMTEPFRAGLAELMDLACAQRTAMMCADTLLARGIPVAHIMGPGKIVAATLTPGAQSQGDGTVLYPGP